MLPYYTSNGLIEAVKRKISVPLTQVTFNDQNILNFAYEELMLEQVPSILQFHEEYLVYKLDIDLIPNQSRYAIPDRAIGMRLRDVFYIDVSGQICQMSRISPDDRNFYEISAGPIRYPIHYYVENNSIILVPKVSSNPVGHLQMSYYLRPNSLVPDDQAAICQSFSKTVTIVNSNIVAGDTLSLGTALTITAGTDFAIGTSDSETSTNLTTYINSLNNPDLSALSSNAVTTIIYTDRNLSLSTSNTSAFVIQTTITVDCPSIPDKILDRTMVDILQTGAGHSTLAYDVLMGLNTVSGTSLTFTESQLPTDFAVGDYICARFESIIPQIPTDLHNLLAERTCSRILASMGDFEGMGTTDAKIKKLEDRQTIILDNRVDGATLKVTNFNGLLRNTRTGLRGRRR